MTELKDDSLTVVDLLDTDLELQNKVLIHWEDFEVLIKNKVYTNSFNIGRMIYKVVPTNTIKPNSIALSLLQRVNAGVEINNKVRPIITYMPKISENRDNSWYIDTINIEVNHIKEMESNFKINSENFINKFKASYCENYFLENQEMLFKYENIIFHLKLKNVKPREGGGKKPLNILDYHSKINLINVSNKILFDDQIAEQEEQEHLIIPDFSFEDLDIGGLDTEFMNIIKKVFVTRLVPNRILKMFGQKHVRGMLLYGPPGCGKTLIARQIGKILNSREPIIVNGPEVMNKYVGQSEENVRELFKEAEKEYKLKGDNSKLHLIIFDEIDALCKRRSGEGSVSATDNIVNQLLSKIDGINSLNNILVIGLTNRKDMIDEAILRPGRLEVHIEIGAPSLEGREQILKIHTKQMRKNNILCDKVNLKSLAEKTEGFSGAELESLVKSVSSKVLFSRLDFSKINTKEGFNFDNLIITQKDFEDCLEEKK